jgi:hypothetical protein
MEFSFLDSRSVSLIRCACLFYESRMRSDKPVIVFVFNTDAYDIRMVCNVFAVLVG